MSAPASGVGVRAEVTGRVGRLVLDRPRALHALTTPMIATMDAALRAWADRDLAAVVITSSGGPAFCAGGDIRALRENALRGDAAPNRAFFAAEYALDARIARYPVPVVSLVGGLCFGGGMGLAVHSAVTVVTPEAVMAMPETGIGLYPDIGATWFLPRLAGGLGAYLGLTGHRLSGAQAVRVGLATHLVPAESLATLADALTGALAAAPDRPVAEVVDELAVPRRRAAATDTAATDTSAADAVAAEAADELAARQADIDHCFSAASVSDVRARLAQRGTWGAEVLAELDRMSPQGLEVALALQHWGRDRSLQECLDVELEVSTHLSTSADFVEGVRAAVVDKDRSPRWAPSTFAGLDADGTASWR